MRIAIIHYWFLVGGGGERVIETLGSIYPGADIFCLFADKKRIPGNISHDRIQCSILNKIPLSHRINRMLFPLYSAAAGSFNFSDYDVIISSDSPPLKGIVPSVDTVHISYCHTPGRFIWDLAPSFTAGLPWLIRPFFAEMAANARIADFVAAQRVDSFIANSNHVAGRIRKYYRRHAQVIYPPVQVADAYISDHQDDYYLSVGRLIRNKRIDLLIEACNRLKRRLVIVGEGRDEKALKAAAGPTIEFVGRASDSELASLYSRCRAFLFAADEDFGIVSVEAQGYGRPVIAYAHGGSLETVRVGDPYGKPDTGILFEEQNPESVMNAILEFEAGEHRFLPAKIREHAWAFDASVFKEKISAFVNESVQSKGRSAPLMNMRRRASDAWMAWDETRREA